MVMTELGIARVLFYLQRKCVGKGNVGGPHVSEARGGRTVSLRGDRRRCGVKLAA